MKSWSSVASGENGEEVSSIPCSGAHFEVQETVKVSLLFKYFLFGKIYNYQPHKEGEHYDYFLYFCMLNEQRSRGNCLNDGNCILFEENVCKNLKEEMNI